jgi:hypothetical protein
VISEELRARIDADMARVPGMGLAETLGFLAGYSSRFQDEIWRGEVTREEIRTYGDAALARARGIFDADNGCRECGEHFADPHAPGCPGALDS